LSLIKCLLPMASLGFHMERWLPGRWAYWIAAAHPGALPTDKAKLLSFFQSSLRSHAESSPLHSAGQTKPSRTKRKGNH
jgi:hypothetical protein